MTAETLLDRLDKVQKIGQERWKACCPAHADKNPSLTVRELPDGTVLLKCWAGCSAAEIVGAVGLEMHDLFPPKENGIHFAKGTRRPFPSPDVFRALANEILIVSLASCDLQKRKALSEFDHARLLQACGRIRAAAREGGLT